MFFKKLAAAFTRPFFLTFFFCAPIACLAVDDAPQTQILKGSAGQLTEGVFLPEIKDPVFYDPALLAKQEQLHKIKNSVSLMIDESGDGGLMIQSDFSADMLISITYTNAQDQENTVEHISLKVNFKTGSGIAFDRLQTFRFEGAKKFKVKIESITSNVTWDFKKLLVLKSELVTVRDYTFDYTLQPATLSYNSSALTGQYFDELKVEWAQASGAYPTEADLEWTWIDATMESLYKTSNVWDLEKIFRNNCSRVSIAIEKNSYSIPLMYDGTGYVFYRVRYAQLKESGQRVEANWKFASSPFSFSGFESNQSTGAPATINWQASASYAEEGKRKVVVSYFDGSMRSRQTVTKDNTTNTTIVAESMYDFQGRPAIQVLPAPTLNTVISYTKNFNTIVSGYGVTPVFFDQINNGELLCSKKTAPFHQSSGAAQYYSPSNPNANFGPDKYIPRADGYVYSEARFMADGRIAEQGGVGKGYQVGDEHSTKYYYGSATDKDLVPLFGTDAGTASHYFKNMVRDANGQYSVSYVDMHGRTVATSLAGDAPAGLEALSSATSRPLTFDLLDPSTNPGTGRSIESIKTLLVPKTSTYTFSYSLGGLSLSLKDCNDQNICYDCSYDLEIIIANECNTPGSAGPIIETYHNISIPNPNVACTSPQGFNINFQKTLEAGSYMITKRLTLSKSSQEQYLEAFMASNTCKTLQQFIDQYQTLFTLQAGDCRPTCADCQQKLPATLQAFIAQFLEGTNLSPDEVTALTPELTEAYNTLKKQCEELCTGGFVGEPLKEIRNAMLADMIGGTGQYASVEDGEGNSLINLPFNVLNNALCWGERFRHPLKPDRSKGEYLDENGQPDPVNALLLTNSFTYQDFIDQFKESWAGQLLPYHPEYPKLRKAESLPYMSDSYKWDEKIRNANTVQQGQTVFSLNPLASDPFYNATGNAGLKDIMQTKLFNHYGPPTNYGDGVNRTFSMWQKAYIMVKCMSGGAVDYSCLSSVPSLPPTDISTCGADWDAIWQQLTVLYLQEKARDVYSFLSIDPASATCTNIASQNSVFTQPLPSAETLLEFKYIPHFLSADQMQGHPVVAPVAGSIGSGNSSYVSSQMSNNFAENCESYRDAWISQLMSCDKIQEMDDEDRDDLLSAITTRLKALCIANSSASHPFGASTGPNGAPSFAQIIREELENADIEVSEFCHPYLVEFPPPYDQAAALVESEIYSGQNPDPCFCDKLGTIQAEKTSSGFSGTLLQYIEYKYGTQMTQGHLDSLVNYCNSVYVECVNLPKPLPIPHALSCEVASKVCLECGDVTSLNALFVTEFGHLPYTAPTEEQVPFNKAYEKFMNAKTGFNKSWVEYTSFVQACQGTPGLSCANLQQIVQNFYAQYGNNLTGVNCRQLFTSFFNNATGLFLTYTDIMALYQQTCGHLPDVCEPKLNCAQFNSIIEAFYVQYGNQIATATNCQALFVQFFNNWFNPAVPYTWNDISAFYQTVCGHALDVCNKFNCTRLQEVRSNFISIYGNSASASCAYFLNFFNTSMNVNIDLPELFRIYKLCNVDLASCSTMQTCTQLTALLTTFNNSQSSTSTTCQADFVAFMNSELNISHTYVEWVQIYVAICGKAPDLCKPNDPCGVLMQQVTNYFVTNPPAFGQASQCWQHFVNYYNAANNANTGVDQLQQAFLDACGAVPDLCYQPGRVVSCQQLQLVKTLFLENYPNPSTQLGTACQSTFKNFFNALMAVNWSYNDIELVYFNECHEDLNICADISTECAKLTLFRTQFMSRYATTGMPATTLRDLFTVMYNREFGPLTYQHYPAIVQAYAACGTTLDLGGESPITVDCATLQSLTAAYRALYPDQFRRCQEIFTDFINGYLQTSYTYDAILQLYYTNCGFMPTVCSVPTINTTVTIRTAGIPTAPARPPLLCGFNTMMLPQIEVSTPDPCAYIRDLALAAAEEQYELYIDSLKNAFDSAYYNKCMKAQYLESFTAETSVSEYHFTLYYYDQAGNLVRTVPPEGVHADYSQAFYDQVVEAKANGTIKVPEHTLPTEYRYNTLNQVTEQNSPDGGKSKFWYDRLGRLALSQNAKQATSSRYSYTKYDALGRITEVGQLTSGVAITHTIARSTKCSTGTSLDCLDNWLSNVAGSREQMTVTVYDAANSSLCGQPSVLCQANLRNRVSYSYVRPTASYTNGGMPYTSATYYSYDIHGNVSTLLQHYNTGVMQEATGNAFKRIDYDYDLISGKVNEVAYQRGAVDQFYHRYRYDAENRLIKVETSADKELWEADARYRYLKHGPLHRLELGDYLVQGVDYAYTLQGWLKGVNNVADLNEPSTSHCTFFNPGYALSVTSRSQYNRPTEYSGTEVSFEQEFESDPQDQFQTVTSGDPYCLYELVPNDNQQYNAYKTRYAYSYSLHYNSTDYQALVAVIGVMPSQMKTVNYPSPLGQVTQGRLPGFRDLYNGNIAAMAVDVKTFKRPLVYNYSYDQLNRLVSMDAYEVPPVTTYNINNVYYTGSEYSFGPALPDYRERISYDANGNLLTYSRNGTTKNGHSLAMDDLTYHYKPGTNQLDRVADQVSDAAYEEDLDHQPAGNYSYDAIGNLIKDNQEGLTSIEWTVYGKIQKIEKSNSTTITYSYDASGQRIGKTVSTGTSNVTTWYVRDAQGNVMAVYEKGGTINSGQLTQREVHLYGSSRLGLWQANRNVESVTPLQTTAMPYLPNLQGQTVTRRRGEKVYELTNHLGNVLVTITDKRIQVGYENRLDLRHYYQADVVTAQDYYPFGMEMPERSYQANNSYRYGFNGKENDNEIKSEGNQQDYGMRVYDPRLGKFLSVDPISSKFPELTPYRYAGNKPVWCIDLDGLEDLPYYWQLQKQVMWQNATPQERRQLAQTERKVEATAVFTMAIVADVFLTKGWATRTLTSLYVRAQVFNSVEHNRPKTLEGQQAQDERTGQARIDAIVGFSLSRGLNQVFKVLRNPVPAKVDLMGGAQSKYQDFINYDKQAVNGIKDDVANFNKHFEKNSVSEIITNNPQATFLTEISEALQKDGTITVRGQMNNPFFKGVWEGKAAGMEGYKVVEGSRKTGLSIKGSRLSDGTSLRGDENSLNEIILKKK